ncbi:hypothetical protein [Terrabacter sp. C0L_2]|uniref:hypothetical protein n=1 Tax=Terrabacter sp. C0L_2 TaxID=3108389 RepID=UPI002ED248CB|nr:hypothetical protein U5C87_17580 [Terrabacter sp. C0L_2]
MAHYTDADVQAAEWALAQPRMHVNTSRGRQESDARVVLDAVAPTIAARALREAAVTYESHARDTFWRDDSPFHASGRFHGELAAEWMQKRADEIERT